VALAALVAGFALWAPLVAPLDPTALHDTDHQARLSPNLLFWFGTDQLARDVFARVVHGARMSLGIALLAVVLTVGLGTGFGAGAALGGGVVDYLAMRCADVLMAFPRLVLLLVATTLVRAGAMVGDAVVWMVVLLAATGWMSTARLVRAEVLALRQAEFVQAARLQGAGFWHILRRHVLPGCGPTVSVSAALSLSGAVALEAGLSFLGQGVRPPAPSWGSMIEDGRGVLLEAWWISLFPGLFLVAVVLSGTLVAEGLRAGWRPARLRSLTEAAA
jgi:peptide/nickel transport system permease protein